MRILITDENTFTQIHGVLDNQSEKLTVGSYYHVEQDDNGTNQQNALFHALLNIYFQSGCYSYQVKTYEEFRNYIKQHMGAGFKSFVYIQETETGLVKGKTMKLENVPDDVAKDKNGGKMLYGELKSWSSYTKKERKDTIDRLISEMLNARVASKKFDSILSELKWRANG